MLCIIWSTRKFSSEFYTTWISFSIDSDNINRYSKVMHAALFINSIIEDLWNLNPSICR